MADTERTVREIEDALVRMAGDIRNIIAVPRVTSASFLLDHEADLLILKKTGYCTEYEIKRSWADFKADFFQEGQALHHCLILDAAVDGRRTETIEIDTARLRIAQCRGPHNQNSEWHQQILSLMEESLPRLGKYVTKI